jgi:hypothetical protein
LCLLGDVIQAGKINIIAPQPQTINSTTDIFVHSGLCTQSGTRFAAGNPASITLVIKLNFPELIPRKKAVVIS